MDKKFVVTGIGTDIGKTVVSAILAEALHANYWKPIQAGDLDFSDSMKVASLTSNTQVLPETFRLTQPLSPHAAAEFDKIEIQIEDFTWPEVDGNLIVEGAGGVMVPINKNGLIYLDLFESWDVPVIIVSKHYLGSINHTLLTIDALKQRGVTIEGIVFNGGKNEASEGVILKSSDLKLIGRIPIVEKVTKSFVSEQAEILRPLL